MGVLLLDEHRRGGSGRGIDVAIDLSEARDQELIGRVRRGDEDAFQRLFRRYAPSALSLARRVVQQPFLAEEIVQEAFLAVWRNPDGYDPRLGSVRAVAIADVADRVVEELGLSEERKAVRAALQVLPAEQRQVIELMYFAGLSQSKIAARLDLPLGTVKSRTLLAMRRLRAELEGISR